ncbi:transmembrane protease serine 3 [Helicoverpa armigera]|uniref:transmembrane protease serine 3 n=1 Tax=Helicoverpa armigera TaxID=29058 RepID=UPI0030828F83
MKFFDMKLLIVTVLALTVVSARHITLEDVIELENNSAYNYLNKIAVPLAEQLRKAEEEGIQDPSRIVGGQLASLGQFPYQAGLLLHLPGFSTPPFCGGILVNNRRILTAAHNLVDAVSSVTQITVVLGSTTIFTGGTRLTTNSFVLHENYNAATIRNDVAMINLRSAVSTSSIIAPIALPSGSQLNENFVGVTAVASGFGRTSDSGGVVANQRLSFVNVPVISNADCRSTFGGSLQDSNICTSGAGGRNICTGDSGGPLAVIRNNRPLLARILFLYINIDITDFILLSSDNMKFSALTLLCLVAAACARHITLEDVIDFEQRTAYGYIGRVGIPLAEKIRKAEEEAQRNPSRIIGGSHAILGQFPYQVGLITEVPMGMSVASAVLVSPTRVLTAAHNLADAVAVVTRINVVLGSVTLFSGGTRVVSSDFVLHENYIAATIRNDVAMINLPSAVTTSSILAPIALPTGEQLNEDFAGDIAIASGYGKIADVGFPSENLLYVDLPVISNDDCAQVFGSFVQPSNVCTSGAGNKGICTGDSGGPLAVVRNNSPLLIGITSFGAGSCESGFPSGYARVTYFMNWINSHL